METIEFDRTMTIAEMEKLLHDEIMKKFKKDVVKKFVIVVTAATVLAIGTEIILNHLEKEEAV